MEGRHIRWPKRVDTRHNHRTDVAFLPIASAASPMINRPCQKRAGLSLACVVALFSLTAFPVLAQDDAALDALVRAYPTFLASHDSRDLIWKDGTRMPVSDGRSDKSFDEKLSNPSILDQLSIPYIKGRPPATPPQDDPGRFRNIAFFDKMYGDCSKGEVQKKLTKVAWLPKGGRRFSPDHDSERRCGQTSRSIRGPRSAPSRDQQICVSECRHVQLPCRQGHW